jgi:Txe/YoeB family toxin of Txe-Axe toxin-antitoxin module
MTHSLEEIVARWEQTGAIISQHEIDALIASWRKRGEALAAMINREPWKRRKDYEPGDAGLADYWSDMAKEFQEIARAALKDKP